MKKVFSILIAFALIIVLTVPAQAAGQGGEMLKGSGEKLKRGALNIVDAVCEIPATMVRNGKEEGVLSGLTKGTLLGVIYAAGRAVVGAFEIGTFFLPIPKDYAPILDEPQFMKTK